jgi:hypothetical protein
MVIRASCVFTLAASMPNSSNRAFEIFILYPPTPYIKYMRREGPWAIRRTRRGSGIYRMERYCGHGTLGDASIARGHTPSLIDAVCFA